MNTLQRLCAWYKRVSKAPIVPAGMMYPCLPIQGGAQFRHGIELLNDSETPMLFVWEALQSQAGLSERDAAVAVALCHEKGGVLIATESIEEATLVAGRVVAHAKQASWPLDCRAVSAPGIQ